jgi:predicted peroxiredoxin
MRKVIYPATVCLLALLLGCPAVEVNNDAEAPADGVLVHVTAGPENPHRLLMALQMAAIMSKDRPVAVYMDIDAVKAVAKGGPDLEMEPFPSAFTQLAVLSERDVPVMACPGCLAVAGIPPDSLMDGIMVADKEKFFSFTDGRIVTLDY